MENNNFQKDVNDVEHNEQVNNVKSKNDIKKTVILLVVVLVLVLAIGIGVGYLMSKNEGNANKNASFTNNANQNINQNANEIEVVKVVSSENSARQMIVEGKGENNDTVWSYTTPAENVPDEIVNRGQKLIETRKGKVYLCDWGKLYILDEQTGKVLAKNTDHNMGAARVYVFDENDNLYTVSYLSNLDKFDTNAKLINSTEEVWNKGFVWPQNMTLSGNNLIIDYGEEGVVTVNKDTFKIVAERTQQNTETETEYNTAVTEIKKCFKDEEWVKQNITMKYNQFNQPIGENEKHKHTFITLSNNSGDKPIIVVEDQLLDDYNYCRAFQLYVVSFENGKVIANSAGDYSNHAEHCYMKVDPNNRIMLYAYGHMNSGCDSYSKILFNKFEKVDTFYYRYDFDENNPEEMIRSEFKTEDNKTLTEDEVKRIEEKYKNCKFYDLNTELTASNVDAYVK